MVDQPVIDEAMVARLVDAEWYRAMYRDVADQDPIEHFRKSGAADGHDPNPMFSTTWYMRRYGHLVPPGLNALEDYVSQGAALYRDPGPLFSTAWYLATNPDVARAGINPLEHYLQCGAAERRDPSPLFDSAWYFAAYPQAAGEGVDARLHYMQEGARLGHAPCRLFDTQWYRQSYSDACPADANPLLHYLVEGAEIGFDPGLSFSTLGYLQDHPEIAGSNENPLLHFLANDAARGRTGSPRATTPPGHASRSALAEARAIIEAYAAIEPDLAALPEALGTIPTVPTEPDATALAWRGLYLSLSAAPRRFVLTGAIDDMHGLADVCRVPDLLLLETDSATAAIGLTLPRTTEWRSIAEFGGLVNAEDRIKITAYLVHALQPGAVLVMGSQAGWEMVARHGKALRRASALYAVVTSAALLQRYLRPCLPMLTALYAADHDRLHATGRMFGLPTVDMDKLRGMADLVRPGGFLDEAEDKA